MVSGPEEAPSTEEGAAPVVDYPEPRPERRWPCVCGHGLGAHDQDAQGRCHAPGCRCLLFRSTQEPGPSHNR